MFDTRKALQECRRVLVEGGAMIFTAPFFIDLEDTVARGYIDAHGTLVEVLPPEYHGDGLNSRGVYTFYNFGWSLFDMMRGIFARVQIGLLYDPVQGFVCADSVAGPWNMPPIVFRAFR
ncbi:MAG TPA: hypothetical protein VFG44_07605 [Burkholderiales bacterium]|nr:hypothetical protein [Burkholderiales bacterium]